MSVPMSWCRGLCWFGLVALVGCTGQPAKDEPLDSDGGGSQVGEDCDDGEPAGTWYGDGDGDGLSDLLVGAYGEDSGGYYAGAAYLLYGGAFGDGY